MENLVNLIHKLETEVSLRELEHHKTTEKNIFLFKVLATVKNDLEKTLKNPDSLKEVVYNCINLLREHTPYYSANEGKNKIDPPLSEEEKTL